MRVFVCVCVCVGVCARAQTQFPVIHKGIRDMAVARLRRFGPDDLAAVRKVLTAACLTTLFDRCLTAV